jgi:hypothetical protein
MEGDNQVLAAEVVLRAHDNMALAGNRGKLEIRSAVTNLQGHALLHFSFFATSSLTLPKIEL